MPVRRPTLSVETYTHEEVRAIQEQVRKRDGNRCVLCGTLGAQVHELRAKSSGAKGSKRNFTQKYMACLCEREHYSLHMQGGMRLRLTAQILIVLTHRFAYTYPKRLTKLLKWYESELDNLPIMF